METETSGEGIALACQGVAWDSQDKEIRDGTAAKTTLLGRTKESGAPCDC